MRITQADQQQPSRRKSSGLFHAPPHLHRGHSLTTSSARNVVLYAFHRDELPFLNVGGVFFPGSTDDDDDVREPEPVVVKGLGVRGLGRAVKVWGSRCWKGVRAIGGSKRSTATNRNSMP